MSLRAVVLNANYDEISKSFEIDSDDFSEVEGFAASEAAKGTKCCIQWSRESDGQLAYWGPRGACLKPHWYSKQGRPEEMQGGKRRNVYLDDASWDKAVSLGNGNASDGIRIALLRGKIGNAGKTLANPL
jgi:hypothetical protein